MKLTKNVFTTEIDGWDTWCKIFQSIPVWKPLVNLILEKENLPVSEIENLTPGSNAVFKSGNYVVKIFAPKEFGFYGDAEDKTEKFSLNFAQSRGVPVSKLVAHGEVKDKYDFFYMILEYINGTELWQVSEKLSDNEKFDIARRLREITDLMNIPCEDFNGIDIIHDEDRHKRWANYPERFRNERLEYIKSRDFGEKVFIHGDLCDDNIIIDNKGEVYIIDFADAVLAPICYEHAHIACYTFNFDKSYLRGYFGDYKADELADICFNGMLIHAYGGDILTEMNTVKLSEEISLSDLRKILYDKIK